MGERSRYSAGGQAASQQTGRAKAGHLPALTIRCAVQGAWKVLALFSVSETNVTGSDLLDNWVKQCLETSHILQPSVNSI